MLKTCFSSFPQQALTNTTCGEIVCQSESDFFIKCKVCDIKIFEYAEFVEHFRTLHWPDLQLSYVKEHDTAEKEELEDAETTETFENKKCGDSIAKVCQRNLSSSDEDEDDLKLMVTEENPEKKNNNYFILQKRIKTKQRQFKCDRCSRTFSTEFYLNFHMRQKHTPKKFQCDKCDKSFVEERYLKLHRRTHDGYSCKQCCAVFDKYEALRYHQEKHIETRNFICDYENCGKGFPNQRRLSAHRRNHFVQPLYVCEICGSRQRSKEFLTVHMRTHTGEKPYSCTLCDRSFASKHFLTDHKAVHATVRPHICDICGKDFAGRKSLYHHRYLHSDVKQFVCKICERSYSQAAGLSAHMRKHKLNSGLLENRSSLLEPNDL